MNFKVRDLIIQVVPQEGPFQQDQRLAAPDCDCTGCSAGSGCGCTQGCSACSTACSGASGAAPMRFGFGCGYTQAAAGCGCTGCSGGSGCACTQGCSGCTEACSALSAGCPAYSVLVAPGQPQPSSRQTLDALKVELRLRLAMIEEQERIMDEHLQPQTREQIEQLEKKLEEALDELRARRRAMDKKDRDED